MPTTRMTIVGMMWIVLVSAVMFAFVRWTENASPMAWLAAVMFIIWRFTRGFWLSQLTRDSLKLARGDRARQRKILQWVTDGPAPIDMKLSALFMLGESQQASELWHESEATFRTILEDGYAYLAPSFESTVREYLADTIDALGRREEAEEVRVPWEVSS